MNKQLTSQGQQKVNDIAQRHDVSTDAVMVLLRALLKGHETMAQFDHPELGGKGQWMQGGMTMVGDMFNDSLKATVNDICVELARLLATPAFLVTSQASEPEKMSSIPLASTTTHPWWPLQWGNPTTMGMQNNIRYAYFPTHKRLVIEIDGQQTIFNTLEHQISGVSQQQSVGGSLAFTSQQGTIDIFSLPIVSNPNETQPVSSTPDAQGSNTSSKQAILDQIERLAELKQKGAITEDEFTAKKTELLSRF